MSGAPPPAESGPLPPAEKVKQFPPTPGVYLMKDADGRVIYIGKAKSLRNRAATYFTKAAAEEHRTAELVKHIADIDFVPPTAKWTPCSWKQGWSRTSSRASIRT